MEAVLLVVAELLAVPLVVAATLLCIVGVAALLLLGHLLLLRRQARTGLRRWWRRVVWTAIGGLGLLVVGLVMIELLLFAPALRIALDQIELRSGVDITFQSASGSLFLGRLVLGDVTVRRSGTADVDFSLTIRSLELDVDMLHIYRRALPVELVRAVGVRGQLVRREAGERLPLSAFEVGRLELEDVQIDFQDTIGAPFRSLALALERLTVAPLRSEYAMRDVLCASEGSGSARGYAFTAGARGWQTKAVPIGPAAHKLGAAGRWIRGGDIDLVLACGPEHDPGQITFDLDLRLHDFKIAPPGDSGRHLPASRLAAAIAALGPDIQVRFGISLARERFLDATNIGQLGLWEAAIQAWNIELGGRLGLSREDLLMLGLGSRLLERVSPGPGVRN